ncbi:MAG: lysophospholipid acyltransferase family protein [Velocimicrobium sp.]
MIGLLLVVLFLIVFAIFSIPMYLIQFIVGKRNPDMQFRIGQFVTKTTFKIILFLSGTKRTVLGLEHLPKEEAVLYVANHRSYFDVVLAYSTLPTPTSFVAKKEIKKIPCIRTWMRYMRCLFLDRDNVREGLKTILQGIEQMKEGYSVFIMPEGTRNREMEMLPFHEGSFKLAEKSGCAIIPVAITHTDKIYEVQAPFIRRTSVAMKYGEPIYMKDLTLDEKKRIGIYTQGIIKNMLEEIEKLV